MPQTPLPVLAKHGLWLGVGVLMLASGQVRAQAQPQAQTDKLFEQAFGKRKAKATQTISLPTTMDGLDVGLVDGRVQGEQVAVSKSSLVRVLSRVLLPRELAALEAAAAPWLETPDLKRLGLMAVYDPARIALELRVPLELRQTREIRIDRRSAQAADEGPQVALTPLPWSLILNSRWALTEQVANGQGQAQAHVFLDGALRTRVAQADWVVEGAGSQLLSPSGSSLGFVRQDLRVVRDWPEQALRLTVGDLNTEAMAGMSSLGLGGIRLSKLYSGYPALGSQSLPSEPLSLPAGAAVDVLVNGFTASSLRLGPGVYRLTDIPMFAGANDVMLRIVEPGGRVREQERRYFFDGALLRQGLAQWDVALGSVGLMSAQGRQYMHERPLVSGWWNRGWSEQLTAGGGLQWRSSAAGVASAHRWMINGLWAAQAGTFAGWLAGSQHDFGRGKAGSLQWRWGDQPHPKMMSSTALSAQLTRLGRHYSGVESDTSSPASTDAGIRLGWVGGGGWGSSVSLSRRWLEGLAANPTVFSLSLRKRLDNAWSWEGALSAQSHASTATGLVPRVYTVSTVLRYTAPTSPEGTAWRASSSAQYSDLDGSRWQQEVQADGLGSWLGGDATWQLGAQNTRSRSQQETGVRAQWMTGRGNLSAQVSESQSLGAVAPTRSRYTELSLSTGLLFTSHGLDLGPPVNDSAAIFVAHKGYESLRLLVDPQMQRSNASADLLGMPVLGGLQAFGERGLQLDVENMPPGMSLDLAAPVLKPSYRSVIAVPVGSDAQTQIKGVLLDASGRGVALQAVSLLPLGGAASPIEMFTNRRGQFNSPPLRPGRYRLVRPGEAKVLANVQIQPDQSGLLDLGQLRLEQEK